MSREEDPGTTRGDHVVIDGSDAAMLRAVRDGLITERPAQFDFGFLPLAEGDDLFMVYGRDVLPIEDAAGLVGAPE